MELARTAIVAVMSGLLGAVTMQAWSLLHAHDARTLSESQQTAQPCLDTRSPTREPSVSAARAQRGAALAHRTLPPARARA